MAKATRRRRKRTSAKNRPEDESRFVEGAFAQIVVAVKKYITARTAAWKMKRYPATASGLKSAKLQLAKRLTAQSDRLRRSGVPLTRRETTALAYVRDNVASCTTDAGRIDAGAWTVFRSADQGDALRDAVMMVNLSWMIEKVMLARRG